MDVRGATPGRLVVAIAAAVVSGFAVFLNGMAVSRFDDATVYTTAKNLVAGAILVVATAAGATRLSEIRNWRPTKRSGASLALIAIIGGAVPFVLFFEGLARATSTNAAFIHKTLVVWVAVGAASFLGERFTVVHAGAVGTLLIGFVVVGGGGPGSFGTGEAMILAATLLWATEVVFVKTVLPTVPALAAATARMGGGAVLLVCWVIVRGDLGALVSLSATQLLWLAATGATLSAFVATWYHALALSPVIDVSAVLVLGAVVTGILNTGLRDVPVTANSIGYVLLAVAAALIIAFGQRSDERRTIA